MNNSRVIYFNDDLLDESQDSQKTTDQLNTKVGDRLPLMVTKRDQQQPPVQQPPVQQSDNAVEAHSVATSECGTPQELTTPTQIVTPLAKHLNAQVAELDRTLSECSSDDESCESISTEKLLSLDPLYIRLTKFLYTSNPDNNRNITEVLEGIEQKMERLITIMEQKM